MKCQILLPGKNKKNLINLPSAHSTHSIVKALDYIMFLSHFVLN